MTNSEFSNEFDVLYNNIKSTSAPGLDEYEKSVFLTKAQDEIVKNYFTAQGNKYQIGFDGNEKRQIDFSMLVTTAEGEALSDAEIPSLFPLPNTKKYSVPNRILMFINEVLTVNRDTQSMYLSVVPLDYKEYGRLMSKPYKRPLKNQAWRILTNTTLDINTTYNNNEAIAKLFIENKTFSDYDSPDVLEKYTKLLNYYYIIQIMDGSSNKHYVQVRIGGKNSTKIGFLTSKFTAVNTISGAMDISTLSGDIGELINLKKNDRRSVVELIAGPNDSISSYVIRYIRRPDAIILTDLENVTLDGKSTKQSCELDPILHQEILQRAVELAKAAYVGDLNSQVQMGQRSE